MLEYEAFLQVFLHLLQLGLQYSTELADETRLCDNLVILWLLDLCSDFMTPLAGNIHQCASIWCENVELWIARNYPDSVYVNALARSRRLVAKQYNLSLEDKRAKHQFRRPRQQEQVHAGSQRSHSSQIRKHQASYRKPPVKTCKFSDRFKR